MKGLVHGVIATNSPKYPEMAWFFRGDQYIRFDFKADRAELGFPTAASNWAPQLASGIDGSCDGRGGYAGKTYIFTGNQYYRYDYAADGLDLGPRELTVWGLTGGFENGVDTVFNGTGAFADYVYFFKGDRYLRYSWTADTVDQAEAPLSAWKLPGAFASGVDAAVTGLGAYRGKTYFFKGDEYVRYDWAQDNVDWGPAPIARWWRGLGELLLALKGGYPATCSKLVFDGRTDDDIADIINSLRATPGEWATETGKFAVQEMENGNLFGIVRAGNAENLRRHVPTGLQGPIDTLRANAYATTNNGETWPADDGGWFRGMIFMNNGLLDQALPGGAMRPFMELVLAHELTHFRNRVERKGLNNDTTLDAARYVDVAKATALAGTPNVRASFVDEIACRHVAWHVGQDRGGSSHTLAKGALFNAANAFARAAVNPARDYNDNGYMTSLVANPSAFNQQVALWLGDVARLHFNDRAAVDTGAQQWIRDDVAFVQPSFAPPPVPASGMA
jgi:hypothetical protein